MAISRALASNSSALEKLRGDDIGQDIQHPGFFFDLLADLREKALDIVDRQREHTEIAGAVHVVPSAQELSRFAHGALVGKVVAR
jgi:hypothetical protein